MNFLPSLLNAMPGAVTQGILWGIMAIGVYITYRILDVADLTVDGSLATGGALCVLLTLNGMNVWLAVLCAMLAVGLTALGGWALVLAAGCVFARYYVVAKKQFGGVTGDLAGWFLQKCEIWMLAALAACQWLGVL